MIRDVLALASNALERQVLAMWLGAGYAPSTIERRLRDKRRMYRRLGRNERDSRIARKLTCENVSRIAQDEARRRPGDRKLNACQGRQFYRKAVVKSLAVNQMIAEDPERVARKMVDEAAGRIIRLAGSGELLPAPKEPC